VHNRQCLLAICNDSQKYANAEKGRLLTTDQKVRGSTPLGCTKASVAANLTKVRHAVDFTTLSAALDGTIESLLGNELSIFH
jgi:hypothetical protein